MVSLPHPEKKQGEDSAFCTPTALGVADGVGGWARKGTYPSPEHGDVQTLPAQPNDLVLVATDGLYVVLVINRFEI
ncbi:hypothetical protein B5M09_000037 [Aphanomyces astaci]|uniref:Protein phosphatase n=1 Tax=Aphanomyces astaci TaxID=112090 RepID=A0A425D6C1_APHAT|nr:hypothetical protein B5M09_000037 [Aphanomyces astaci]